MTKQVQRRRGTDSQHTSFTGADGELSVNTTNKSVHVHDGVTAGGVEAARADLDNVLPADIASGLSGGTVASLTITSADINGGNIDGTSIGGSTPAAGTFSSISTAGSITVAGTVDGRDVAADGTKLDGIEAGATADQTAAEIKAAYEINADTNVFDDAAVSKLAGIEAGATADQTGSEIATAISGETVGSLTITSADINGGTIDNVTIGGTTAGAGTFTTGTFTSGASSAAVHSYTQLEIESASHSALQFSGSTGAEQWIWFADDSSNPPVGGITYYHGGPYMGFRVEGSERLRIDNSGNVGIGTSSPSYAIDTLSSGAIVAQFKRDASGGGSGGIRFGNNDKQFTLYGDNSNGLTIYDGSTERMRIDSSGRVAMPYQPAFSVGGSSNTYITQSPILFNTIELNRNNVYNSSTGEFTAPVSGAYKFDAHIYCRCTTGQTAFPRIQKSTNGGSSWTNFSYAFLADQASGQVDTTLNINVIMNLNANDLVRVIFGGTGDYYHGNEETRFSGFLIG